MLVWAMPDPKATAVYCFALCLICWSPCCVMLSLNCLVPCRYLTWEQDSTNKLRHYGSYDKMKETVLAKKDEVDLKAPIALCEMYGLQTEAVLNAIKRVRVSESCQGPRN